MCYSVAKSFDLSNTMAIETAREKQEFILIPNYKSGWQCKREEQQLAVNFKLYNECDMHPMHLSNSHRNILFSMTHQQCVKRLLQTS